MGCSLCLFRNPLALVGALLVPVSVTVCFLGYGFFPILFTTLFLVSSSIFFASSKHLSLPQETSLRDTFSEPQPESDVFKYQKEEPQEVEDQGEEEEEVHGGYKVGPTLDTFSESESMDHSTITDDQGSEVDWPFATNLDDRSPDCSDGSISDEESLIEIDLPGGHYVASPPKQKSFNQNNNTLMELLAEINEMYEEDNLIEIDISMGSIKCSRFEIAA